MVLYRKDLLLPMPYAVPTPDHFLPIPYILGATQGEKATFFNQIFDLGSMDMTGFTFGLE